MDDNLRHLLVCPACRGDLAWSPSLSHCVTCAREYEIDDGIPVLLGDAVAAAPEAAPIAAPRHKQQQAAFYDREDAEFEISRPHGTPRLYRWLLAEKFRRSVSKLDPHATVCGATALTVCGGSGMDAEFLARAGARVISSDIALGGARRARERARRYGAQITPIVADVECLPFRDQAIDVVYVHDGLHHLEHPATGLAEMARVAARAVSVNEPALASATALAIRLGWSVEYEEAGNRVARMTLDGIVDELRSRGFRIVQAERYAMYYRHEPGTVMVALSQPGLFALSRWSWRVANGLVGGLGNKLTVQARRGS